jgi:zinc protease
MTTVTRHRLKNGLTILAEPMHDAPVVALQAWVNVGAADEKPPHLGIAHLHEHMLFKGTAKRKVGQIARDVEAVGGEINAWTSFDQTVYHVVMAAQELDAGVDILSDALSASTFDKDELAREIQVVIEEIRRAKDSPARRLSNALFETVFTKHPYRRPVLGTEASVSAMDQAAMLDFFRAHYRPDNVTFVAVGDFKTPELLALLEKYLGNWQPHADFAAQTPEQTRAPRSAEPAQKTLEVKTLAEDVKEARVALAWQVPALHHADVPALDLLTTILGHGEASRLHNQVVRKGAVTDAYAYAYTPKDQGMMVVGASLRPEHIASGVQALLAQSYALTHAPVAEDELARAKTMLLSDVAYQRETVQGQANKRGYFEVGAGDYQFEEQYLKTLAATDAKTLLRVAQTYLHAHPAVVLQHPKEAEIPQVQALKDLVAKSFTDARASHTAQARTPKPGALGVISYTLANGATLLVRPENSPVVAMRAAALGGQRYETPADAGLGMTFASVWGLATQSLQPEALAAKVAALGGGLSAFSGRNTVGLRGEFVAEHAMAGLALFAEALLRPEFLQADFERERDLLCERVRTRDDNPAGVAFDAFAAHLFPKHPYGLPALGTMQSLKALSCAQMSAYHKRFAAPDKFILCVAGNVEPDKVYAALAPAFETSASEPLPAPPTPDADYVRDPNKPGIRIALPKQQAHCLIGAQGTTMADADRYGIDVMCAVLSGQSGRLFTDLRDVQSLAYSVSCSNAEGIDPGHIFVYIGCAFEKVQQALAGVYGHLQKLRDEPITPAELTRAQRYLTGSHAIDLQRSGARAMAMALNARYGLGYDAMARYPDGIRAVTVADVQKLAQKYLAPTRLLEVVVGPAD